MKRAAALFDEAKTYNINLSQTLEDSLREAVSTHRAAQWKQDNAEAMALGLPSMGYP